MNIVKEKKQISSDDYYKKLIRMTEATLKMISEAPGIGFDIDKATLDYKMKLRMDIRKILNVELDRHYIIGEEK